MSIAIPAMQTPLSTIHQNGQEIPSKAPNGNIEGADKTEHTNSVDSIQKEKDAALSNQPETPRLDEYIHTDGQTNPAGIYSLSKDENGNPKIVFDNPNKQKDKNAPDKADDPASNKEPQITKCISDTSKVDAEIKKLQEKQQKIQQKLSQLPNDSDKRAELEKQLSNVEMEIKAKDNDAYKKQNASYTFSDAE